VFARYRVDRQRSVDALDAFLRKKDIKLEEERKWLIEIQADCVLVRLAVTPSITQSNSQISQSDAAFLGW
jgi:hypothetical protein